MKKTILPLVAALAATASLRGAMAELNPATGTIEAPDGSYTARDMWIAPGFKLELLYVVPRAAEGSWVPMTWDNKGRLIVASHNTEQMFRLTIPNVGTNEPVKVEPLDVRIGSAHGLLYAFNSLYVMVDEGTTRRNGLYRLTDTNGDDQYDKVEIIRVLQGRGQHGVHSLELTPDGKRIVMMNGNDTFPSMYDSSSVPFVWAEDQLLPRMDDKGLGGHASGRFAPGGWTASMNPDGSDFRLETMGYRNPVDFIYNKDGELFVYDADLEFDKGTPWYRPTRVNHHISGADYGWRHGSGKFPKYYFDTFGQVVGIGSGSPTGVSTGRGAKFPAKFQDAIFLCDWSYGNIYAVHLTPNGASYTGTAELFAKGRPFGVSDLRVNPNDGSMIVLVGGNNDSVVYRVSYVGNESTAPTKPDARFAAARAQRHYLESFHGHQDPVAVDVVWPFLKNEDRALRQVARTALEWQNVAQWRDRALSEQDPKIAIEAIGALIRVSASDVEHRENRGGFITADDRRLQSQIFDALDRIDLSMIDYQDKLDLVRAYTLALTRFAEVEPGTADLYPVRGKLKPASPELRNRLLARWDKQFPSGYRELNWEVAELLSYLEAPNIVERMIVQMRRAPTQQYFPIEEFVNPQQRVRGDPGVEGGLSNAFLAKQEDEMKYVELLRTVDTGWTPALRKEYLQWFPHAFKDYQGGASFLPFVQFMQAMYVKKLSDADKAAIDDPALLEPLRAFSAAPGAMQ